MNKKLVMTMFAIFIMASPLFIQCMPVSAFAPNWANKTDVTYDYTWDYTRYVGVLGGAHMKSLCRTIGMDT